MEAGSPGRPAKRLYWAASQSDCRCSMRTPTAKGFACHENACGKQHFKGIPGGVAGAEDQAAARKAISPLRAFHGDGVQLPAWTERPSADGKTGCRPPAPEVLHAD